MTQHGRPFGLTSTGRFVRTACLVAVFVCLCPALASQESEREPAAHPEPTEEERPPERRRDRRKALLEGTHAFRRILFDSGLRPLTDFDELTAEPRRTILIVLGDLNVLARVPGGLGPFVHAGGAVLAASDRAITDRAARRAVIDLAGVSVSGDRVICPNTMVRYRDLFFCPFVIPVPGAHPPVFRDGTSAFLAAQLQVVTNMPSHLIRRRGFPGTVRPLAYLPAESVIETVEGSGIPDREQPLFAVGGEVGEGRVLVLADHSVFINEMMLPVDTANVEFTYNVVRWLRGQGDRDRVLFVEDGRVETRFEIPLKSVALPAEEALRLLFARRNELLVEGERALARMEDDSLFNRVTLDALERIGLPPSRLVHLAMTLGTVVALLLVLYRLGVAGRFRHDPAVAPLPQALARAVPDSPLAEQRRAALLKRGDLREPAAALVRQWFAELGVDPAAPAMPAFTATGGVVRRWRVRGRLRALWRLATGAGHARITAPGLWRLQRELDRLGDEWRRGAWRTTAP